MLLSAVRKIIPRTVAALALVASVCAFAQSWPAKPIRLIVPFPPGGSTDVLGRIVAAKLTEALGQQVLVDNRGGAGGVIGTDLVNPDFPALARAYGAHGERVERTADFADAFERALASGRPSVLELPVDPERISPRVKLSELRGSV